MAFRKYQWQIPIRVVLIVATCLVIAFVWQLNKYWFTLANLGALLVIQTILLIRYLSKWQRDLRVFAASVQHGDFTISYNLVNPNDDHYEVYSMLNRISGYVRELNAQYIQQTQYFRHVVENVQVGLLVFDSHGKVVFVNRECLDLLGRKEILSVGDLKRTDERLLEEIQRLQPGQPALLSGRNQLMKLSGRKSTITVDGKTLHLLSLVNIREEIEATELKSWQELISVLTHEIMNSITPIHSLSGSMTKYLDKIEGNEEIVTKAQNSLQVINRRSQSLMNFVERYRTVSTVPLPALQLVHLRELVGSVLRLLENELQGVKVHVDDDLGQVYCDPVQIEQVLINLIKNAVHAMEAVREKVLQITSVRTDGLTLSISDNGAGIPSELLDKIFVPFFTTRQGGSGIGLTLSRQIMQRHGGSISVESTNNGTTFRLYLPKPSLK